MAVARDDQRFDVHLRMSTALHCTPTPGDAGAWWCTSRNLPSPLAVCSVPHRHCYDVVQPRSRRFPLLPDSPRPQPPAPSLSDCSPLRLLADV